MDSRCRVPYRQISALGQIGAGTLTNTNDKGIGDVMVKMRHNMLPTLRSILVFEMGVYLPTGDYGHEGAPGQLTESTLQVGNGAFGFQPGFYQTYEVLPHRLNQFLSGHSRYNLRNSDGYQSGQEYALNTGVNLVTLPLLTLTEQINFRYKTQDNIEAQLFELQGAPFSRPVPTTNSTYLAFSTGFVVNVFDYGQLYICNKISATCSE